MVGYGAVCCSIVVVGSAGVGDGVGGGHARRAGGRSSCNDPLLRLNVAK